MKRLSHTSPIRISLTLVLIIVVFRILDVFVIRSDEIFGEQYLTKVVGMVLVFAYVWRVKGNLAGIGFHAQRWKTSVILGALIMAVGLTIGYSVEWFTPYTGGQEPDVFVSAQGLSLVPGEAATGGLLFGFSILLGNVINSFMEESLFRGVLITHLGSRMALSWTAHTLNNSVINLVHITTAAGDPGTLGLRVAVSTLVVAASMPLVKRIAAARKMPEVARWV